MLECSIAGDDIHDKLWTLGVITSMEGKRVIDRDDKLFIAWWAANIFRRASAFRFEQARKIGYMARVEETLVLPIVAYSNDRLSACGLIGHILRKVRHFVLSLRSQFRSSRKTKTSE